MRKVATKCHILSSWLAKYMARNMSWYFSAPKCVPWDRTHFDPLGMWVYSIKKLWYINCETSIIFFKSIFFFIAKALISRRGCIGSLCDKPLCKTSCDRSLCGAHVFDKHKGIIFFAPNCITSTSWALHTHVCHRDHSNQSFGYLLSISGAQVNRETECHMHSCMIHTCKWSLQSSEGTHSSQTGSNVYISATHGGSDT